MPYRGRSGSPSLSKSLPPFSFFISSSFSCLCLQLSILSFQATLPYPYAARSFEGSIDLGCTARRGVLLQQSSEIEGVTLFFEGFIHTHLKGLDPRKEGGGSSSLRRP